jgi:hypothetical protein
MEPAQLREAADAPAKFIEAVLTAFKIERDQVVWRADPKDIQLASDQLQRSKSVPRFALSI